MDITLHLTTEELELLSRILEERQKEVLNEIHHTDHHDFKLVLRKRAELLEALLNKVSLVETVLL
jgi:hypothetical protein